MNDLHDDANLTAVPWRGRSSIRIVAAAVGAILVAVMVAIVLRGSDNNGDGSPVVGRVVPALAGTTLAGDHFDIDEHRGRWAVVNLFATWCVPCQVEHPELVAFDAAHRGDAQVVSVVFADDDDAVRDFFAERGGDWPVLGSEHAAVVIDFGATGVPETFVVSPDGVVVAQFRGGITHSQLDDAIGATH